jgi:Zn ribbon nucleic-acid-binding protein
MSNLSTKLVVSKEKEIEMLECVSCGKMKKATKNDIFYVSQGIGSFWCAPCDKQMCKELGIAY